MKSLVIGLMLVLITSVSAFAQVSSSDDATVNVNAYVTRTVSVDVIKGLEIGNVTAGIPKTITAAEEFAGEVSIFSTNRNTPFIVTITTPTVLVSDGTSGEGDATLPISFTFNGSAVTGNKTALFAVTPGNEYWTGPANVFGPILRSVYIGATVTPAEDQQGGAYIGQVIVSVATN
jgi:hypothetical protein